MPLSTKTLLIVLSLWLATPVAAQQNSSADVPDANLGEGERWQPLGRIPVDQAGAGLRGYALAGESAEAAGPGMGELSLHVVTSNNFYREQTGDVLITQRYETHTLALGYRRGLPLGSFRRFELGGQIQIAEGDNGFLNGFIQHVENFLYTVTRNETVRNPWRASGSPLPPLGTIATKDGLPFYQSSGSGSGLGDTSLIAKALLRDGPASSNATAVAARVVLNIAGKSEFTSGNFAGLGVSVDKRLSNWVAFHGDVRASVLLDRVSTWNLPLKRQTFGFSAGTEMKLTRSNSLNIQVDGSTTPYLSTGTTAFDSGYGDIGIGAGHRSAGGRVLTQVYLRENMNLPFRVRWNIDPDLALGIKTTIRTSRR